MVERLPVKEKVPGSSPGRGALIEIEQEIAQFLFYPHTKALAFFAACPVGSRSDSFGVRTLAITWLDTSETVFIGTSEFSKEILNFLSIRERFEPRVERISFFFSPI